MSVKEENEITVRVLCSKKELSHLLATKGFKVKEHFTLNDCYLIPSDMDISKYSSRALLSKAIIVRTLVIDNKKIIKRISYKIKKINDKGEILSQQAINCHIMDTKEAITLFEALGYRLLMTIKESDIVYTKNDLELSLKLIKGSKPLIEIETIALNEELNTIAKLKKKIEELELPIEPNNYFVKKAEEALNKIKSDML